ncbi:glycosyltransferase family 4 protein [Massilia sp. LXY-6]|uniref:glycosyltransferase family 4 protein n=1 Tax=Massilia sp. LXY-6 TaxID=3379823 RepID=UPI003EDF53B0
MAIPDQTNIAPIRLIHLQLLPLLSGVQKVTLDEFSKLDKKKYEPVLVCKESGPLVEAVKSIGAKCEYIPSLAREISLKADGKAFLELVKCFRRLRPDVVHTHSSKTGILGRLAARVAGVPNVIHTVHGFAFPFAKSRFVRCFYFVAEFIGGLLSNKVVVLNATDYNYAIKNLRLPKHKVHLIPNGVNIEAFGIKQEVREDFRKNVLGDVDQNMICIGMVGRLWAQKNPLCLVEAAKKIFEKTDFPVKFFFAGDGELKGEVESKVKEYKLSEKVEVLGWRSDIPVLLSSIDIFVLPSLWEGMPLAILEAMASNLPVVVSDIPGNHDLVDHNNTGLLFEADNAEDLSIQLLKLIEDIGLRQRLAVAARMKVSNAYSLSQRMAKITELYDSVDSLDEVGEQPGLSY